jgi:tetratricopeptide (TPR) repeat protein
VLEELLASAVFETLDALLRTCLQQPSSLQLAQLAYTRLEAQFGTTLVRDAFGYIECARYGMSEVELIGALCTCQADWAIFIEGVRMMLTESAGQYNFSSSVMRDAYCSRYLPTKADAQRVHRKLMHFFENAPADVVSEARRCVELPYQMLRAREMSDLERFLIDIRHVRLMLDHHAHDLQMYWVEATDGDVPDDLASRYLAALDKYKPILKQEIAESFLEHDSRQDVEYEAALATLCSRIATFLVAMCQYDGAAALQRHALDIDHAIFDNMSARVAQRTRELAQTLYLQGKYKDAEKRLNLSLGVYSSLAKESDDGRLEYARTLVEMATVARYTEDCAKAKRQCTAALATFRKQLGEGNPRIAPVLARLSMLCLAAADSPEGTDEDIEEARAYALEAKTLCEGTVGAAPGGERFDTTLAEASHLLGKIELWQNRVVAACELLQEALSLVSRAQGTSHLLAAEIFEDLAIALLRKRHDAEPAPPPAAEPDEDSGEGDDKAPEPLVRRQSTGAPPKALPTHLTRQLTRQITTRQLASEPPTADAAGVGAAGAASAAGAAGAAGDAGGASGSTLDAKDVLEDERVVDAMLENALQVSARAMRRSVAPQRRTGACTVTRLPTARTSLPRHTPSASPLRLLTHPSTALVVAPLHTTAHRSDVRARRRSVSRRTARATSRWRTTTSSERRSAGHASSTPRSSTCMWRQRVRAARNPLQSLYPLRARCSVAVVRLCGRAAVRWCGCAAVRLCRHL